MSKQTSKPTLADVAYENIRKEIAQGLLKPGEKINVQTLADRYNVSLTPVKLALNRLVTEKVVENFPHQGMHVREAKVRELEEIFDLRLMLDLYYTKEIITTVNYDQRLRNLLQTNVDEHWEMMERLHQNPTIDAYLETYEKDEEFHRLYLKCSGSSKIVELFNYMNPFLYSHYIYRKQSPEKDLAGVQEHKEILSAILQEDEPLLRNILKEHHTNSKNTVSLVLRANEIVK